MAIGTKQSRVEVNSIYRSVNLMPTINDHKIQLTLIVYRVILTNNNIILSSAAKHSPEKPIRINFPTTDRDFFFCIYPWMLRRRRVTGRAVSLYHVF
jgi:hypothetical protein